MHRRVAKRLGPDSHPSCFSAVGPDRHSHPLPLRIWVTEPSESVKSQRTKPPQLGLLRRSHPRLHYCPFTQAGCGQSSEVCWSKSSEEFLSWLTFLIGRPTRIAREAHTGWKQTWCAVGPKKSLVNAEYSYCWTFGVLLVCSVADLAAGFDVWLAGFSGG